MSFTQEDAQQLKAKFKSMSAMDVLSEHEEPKGRSEAFAKLMQDAKKSMHDVFGDAK